MNKKFLVLALLAALAAVLLAGCDQADSFVPLPPPVGEEFPMNQIVQTIGETEQVRMQAPFATVDFGQTGSFAGGLKLEEICLKQKNLCATMLSTTWGSWSSATIERAESYDPNGKLLGGWIEESLPDASIFQWLHGCLSCTIKRSRLMLEYISPEPGDTPILSNIYYFEEWGLSKSAPFAFGTAHKWSDNLNVLFPDQARWGFWESHTGPFEQVIEALNRADLVLRAETPSIQVIDHDSVGREFIGRQSGFTIVRQGLIVGTIDLTYANTWGQMPNTTLISKGALSRIEWRDGDYYGMSVLSPVLSPEPTSLYVFCNTAECGDYVARNQQQWPQLYEQIRNQEIPGLEFAVYSIGHIGAIVKSTGEETVHVGDGGGVHYSIIGSPTVDQVDRAYRSLSMLGLNGVKALGLYYATKPASGSGLEYYLATVRLAMAPDPLSSYGWDVGQLDRVGFLPD